MESSVSSVSSVPPEGDFEPITKTIRKRDGVTVQSFDVEKIRRAVSKAWLSEYPEINSAAVERVIRLVLSSIENVEVTVEDVQDLVELALMKIAPKVAKHYIIYREERAKKRALVSRKPDPKAVSDYIHAGKYARHRSDLGRREVYAETVARDEGMHITRFPQFEKEIREAFQPVYRQEVLPSMRSLQFAGEAILKNHAKLFNCCFSHINRLEALSEAMHLLLCGCGVGYSIQREHVECLPVLARIDTKRVRHHVVEDTIEGWADAEKALIMSYTTGEYVEFAFHKIRAAGTLLKTSGGRAPGHIQLKKSLEAIRAILNGAQGRQMRPIECHRILCIGAETPLSGGVRRSAMIALFSLDDEEMKNCKTGDWFSREPYLQNANNSVVLVRGEVREKEFKRVFDATRQWGEPGFYFTWSAEWGVNPCVEVQFFPTLIIDEKIQRKLRKRDIETKIGDTHSGWGFCVSGNTTLVTRTGRVNIAAAVGKTIETWNGSKWRKTKPFQTGAARKLYRVSFSDGSYLDCTDNHKFLVKDNSMDDYVEVETKNLLTVSDRIYLPRANVVSDGGISEPMAYEYGFFIGDGSVRVRWADVDAVNRYYYAGADLYGDKDIDLPLRGERGPLGKNPNGVKKQYIQFDLNVDLCRTMKGEDQIPNEVFTWDRASVLNFVGGWADADGTQANDGIRVYGSEGRMRDLQLLLTKVGINSSVNLMQEAGIETNLGVRKNAVWYVQVPNATGIRSARLHTADGKEPTGKGRVQVVRSVEELPGLHKTYCLEEPEAHICLFNNVLTKQCNLTTINASKLRSLDDFLAAAKAATFIGTLQATYTSFPYLGWVSEAIAERDALLGVSMTGMLDSPAVSCNPEFQQTVARHVKSWNRQFAEMFGIEAAARTTLVKPEGTSSLALGGVASGHHAHHSRRYIRRVIADQYEPVFQAFQEKNPHMCKLIGEGKWVIEFPVEIAPEAMIKADLTAIEFLEMVRSTQKNWVGPGTNLERTQHHFGEPLTHNVSNSVHVRKDEWNQVADYLWEHRNSFSGVSFIEERSDKQYANAPFEAVITDADEAYYHRLLVDYTPLDYSSLHEEEDGTSLRSEAACAGGTCEVNI